MSSPPFILFITLSIIENASSSNPSISFLTNASISLATVAPVASVAIDGPILSFNALTKRLITS